MVHCLKFGNIHKYTLSYKYAYDFIFKTCNVYAVGNHRHFCHLDTLFTYCSVSSSTDPRHHWA